MRRQAVIVSAVLLIALGCSSPEPQTSSLQEIPAPSLSGAEPAVRQQIEEKLQELEGLRADAGAADAAELSRAYGDLGLLYLTYSFVEAAEVSFSNAQSLAAGDYEWPYLLGYIFQIQGRLEEASTVLSRALELEPGDVPSLIRLGRVKIELGNAGEAGPLFERALAADPDSAAALDGLGKVAAAQGEAAAAVDYFERALELQPRASSAHHALGLAYRKLGDLEQAEVHLGLGGDAPVLFADPHLSSVAELGRSAELYLVRGAQAFSEERYDQAAEYYRKALQIEPTDFTARKALGFCLEKIGDLDGAVAQLQEAMERGTTGEEEKDRMERSEVLRVLGGLRMLQGREEEGIAAFRQALELDPERLVTHSRLGNALARQGHFEEAIVHYDRVLEARPDVVKVRVRRATARINLGQPREALADFEQAVATAPEDFEIRLVYAEALEHLGDPRAAAEQRSAASRLAASDPVQQAKLVADEGAQRLAGGDFEGALERFEEAARLDPANVEARYQRATILGHLGRLDDALGEFAGVIAASPHHGPARRAEATTLLLQGRYGEARERLQKSLEVMPRNQELAHALARLLAVAPVSGVRDGELALSIATRVHEEAQRADTAETLAMAFAEAGRFAEAQQLQQQLLQAAERSGRAPGAGRWRAQLSSYEQARPWRAASPDEVIAAMGASSGRSGGSPGR